MEKGVEKFGPAYIVVFQELRILQIKDKDRPERAGLKRGGALVVSQQQLVTFSFRRR